MARDYTTSLKMIIRPAEPGDALAVAAIKTQSWRHAYSGIVPDAVLDAMNPGDVRKHWLGVAEEAFPTAVLVLDNGQGLSGYVMFGLPQGASLGYSGQLYELYLRPSIMGTGAGHALFSAAVERLRQDSHDGFHLWVFEANGVARRFYERRGGLVVADSRKRFAIAGHPVWEVAYGFRPLPDFAAKR